MSSDKSFLTAEDYVRLEDNVRTVLWGEVLDGEEVVIDVNSYEKTRVVRKGAVNQYKIDCVNVLGNHELFLLPNERFVFSVPATAMGDKIFYAIRHRGLFGKHVRVTLKKVSERLGYVISVEELIKE